MGPITRGPLLEKQSTWRRRHTNEAHEGESTIDMSNLHVNHALHGQLVHIPSRSASTLTKFPDRS